MPKRMSRFSPRYQAPYKRKYSRTRPKYSKRGRAVGVVIPKALRGFVRSGGVYGTGLGSNSLKSADFQVKDAQILSTAGRLAVSTMAGTALTGDSLNLIEAGTDIQNRIGRKITIKDIEMRGVMTFAPTSGYIASKGAASTTMMLVLDTQANGAVADPALIFNSLMPLPSSLPVVDNQQRFKVLKRWDHQFKALANPSGDSTTGTSVYQEQERHFSLKKSVSIPIEYSGTSSPATVALIRSNNLFLIAGCQDSADSTFVSVKAVCRLRFLDG